MSPICPTSKHLPKAYENLLSHKYLYLKVYIELLIPNSKLLIHNNFMVKYVSNAFLY